MEPKYKTALEWMSPSDKDFTTIRAAWRYKKHLCTIIKRNHKANDAWNCGYVLFKEPPFKTQYMPSGYVQLPDLDIYMGVTFAQEFEDGVLYGFSTRESIGSPPGYTDALAWLITETEKMVDLLLDFQWELTPEEQLKELTVKFDDITEDYTALQSDFWELEATLSGTEADLDGERKYVAELVDEVNELRRINVAYEQLKTDHAEMLRNSMDLRKSRDKLRSYAIANEELRTQKDFYEQSSSTWYSRHADTLEKLKEARNTIKTLSEIIRQSVVLREQCAHGDESQVAGFRRGFRVLVTDPRDEVVPVVCREVIKVVNSLI